MRSASGVPRKEQGGTSESKKSRRTFLSKVSRSTGILLNIYTFFLIGALLFASMYFINFTTSSPFGSIEGSLPILVPANETRVEKFMLSNNNSTLEFYNDSNTCYINAPRLYRNDTDWNGINFYVDVETQDLNQTMNITTTTVYPDGHNETSSDEGVPNAGVFGASGFNASLGLYSVEIRNSAETDLNGTLTAKLFEQVFEKPYYYYGLTGLYMSVAGLIMAVIYLILKGLGFSRMCFERARDVSKLAIVRFTCATRCY